MRKILLIILILTFGNTFSQKTVDLRDIYTEEGLTYSSNDNKLFSGKAQHIRKNGHLVYEEYFEDGKLTKTITYYNGTDEPTPSTITEYYIGTDNKKTTTNYGLKKPTVEFVHYDQNGNRTLIERFEDENLIYRCEFQNNRKHGIEFCLDNNGEELRIEYENGKKVKKA
ncbi:hypothetical protein MG296_14205 [Flavobacteriaceae bacterium TK19130]|nr:hypothetical protein [Thermobacterium salinum]